MLKKLNFNEINENWDEYKSHLKNAGVSSHTWAVNNNYFNKYFEVVMGRVLSEMQDDRMHLWISYEGKDDYDRINYLCITRILIDPFTRKKNLNIFAITRIHNVEKHVADQMWIEAFSVIMQFASACKCEGVLGTTLLEHLFNKAKQTDLFGEALFSYKIYWPVNSK